MNFRTRVEYRTLQLNLKIYDNITFLGSCFAQNIGFRFSELNLNVAANPLGIVYNPLSLFEGINRALNPKPLTDEELVEQNELFHSWKHHGSCSNSEKEELIQYVFEKEMLLGSQLQQSKVLFLTLGSAWAFRHKGTQSIVANCHKVNQSNFQKELIRAEEIEESFKITRENLLELNPLLKVVFTVSPVRYLRDGLVENNRSKAELIRAVHNLCEKAESCYYLPAYEWVIDDLRDYRFFEQDMVHPSKQAVKYVYDNLIDQLLEPKAQKTLRALQKLHQAVNHRPLNPNSAKHYSFIHSLQNQIDEMEQKTGLDFSNFREKLSKQQQKL